MPRLINFCGRTQDSIDYVFDFIEKNPSKITRDFLALLNEPVKYTQNLLSSGFPYRGSMIIKQKDVREDGNIEYNYYSKETLKISDFTKSIWFFFSGMGSQWIGMAKAMMAIDKFAETINKCAKVLEPFKIDLLDILLSDDETALNSIVNPFIGITAMHIALIDVLNELNIQPDKIIGHSLGEIACAYADGCLNLEQTMLCSYWRGKVLEDRSIPNGKMAAVGLSWKEAIKRCPKNVYVACDNAPDSVTISGLEDDVTNFMDQLISEEIFVHEVAGAKMKPFHTKHLEPVVHIMTEALKNVIPQAKHRSNKWLSTSVPFSNWQDKSAQYASAEYFVNNFVNPVLFTSTLSQAPVDAIVIEIAPHALFANLIKRTLKDANYIGLMKRNNNQQNLEMFFNSIGKLYQLGINPSIENLYPKVEWPVARGTQSISSLMRWDHSDSYLVKKYPEYYFPSTASDMTFEFSLDDPEYAFLQDHVIDENVLFPATGYLMLAWRRLAAQKSLQWNQVSVVFENVQFRRTVQFQNGKVKLTVRYTEPTGEFVVLDGEHVAAVGKVFADVQNQSLQLQYLIKDINDLYLTSEKNYKLNKEDFYKELKVRGYDYGKYFHGVEESYFIDENKIIGKVKHENNSNFISTLDSILQLTIIANPIRLLFIPTSIQSFKCDPQMFVESNNLIGTKLVDNKEILNDSTKEEKVIEISKKDKNLPISTDLHFDVNVIFDKKLKALIGNGIEITGIKFSNLNRKSVLNKLRLEKYQFIPYYEDNAIENYHRNEIMKYLNVCSAICKQIFEKTEYNLKKIENFDDIIMNIQIDQKIIDEMIMNINEEHILLNTLCSILNIEGDLSNNTDSVYNLKQRKELNFDLSYDLINLVGRNERLIRPMIDTVNENINPMLELKVLEINTTNGIIEVDISQYLTETFILPVAIEYTIAHNKSEKIRSIKELENTTSNCNIVEWNHYNSNFPENIKHKINLMIHYDSFELWNVDLNNYFASASNLFKENGFLLAVFRSTITTPEIILNQISKDGNLPNENQLLNRIKTFEKTASKNGFKIISKKTDSILFTAILFRKINENLKATEQTVVEVKTGEYHVWIEQLKQIIQEHKDKNENSNIWLHANDSNINGIIGLVQCLRQESIGDNLRYIFDLDNKLPNKIDFNIYPFKEILENNLVMNVFKDNNFGSFKHLNLPKNYDIIETNNAYASTMQKGNLSNFQWFDGRNLKNPLISTELNVQQKDVDIYYSSLNFRDIMLESGRLTAGPYEAICETLLGSEFAGRRRDTGERVFGITSCYGIATENKTYEPFLFKIPDQWSMEDAATVFTVYMTVWYGLIERGQLQEGESILIHSGAGGVGQAAINVCKYYKCRIFTTVSTQEKRDFLKKNFGLTDEQIFNSRNTDFLHKILELTKGNGVDLVLNSLAEEKLMASFKCLDDDGRFIEIGKYDLLMNNPLPMHAFLKNISFHGIALDKICFSKKKFYLTYKNYQTWLFNGIEKGFIKPLNRTIFGPEKVREAFKYIMTGKNVGKVLIKIRDEEDDRRPLKAKPIKMIATTKTWFDSEKVYIIIGGLGGMGLEMVYWMLLRGAQKFVLTSRSGIKSNYQRFFFKQIDELAKMNESFRIKIKISINDVVDEQHAKKVINNAESMGKIGGIFQLAVVIHDALFDNQTAETFNSVCKPKVDATINLDKLSRQLPYKLDYFVCFSSIISGRGNTGQTSYGYANSVMERICENRRKDGLHGLAIQWGPIDDVGIFFSSNSNLGYLSLSGLVMQRLPSWLYALDKCMQCPYPVVTSFIRTKKHYESKTFGRNMFKEVWSLLGVDPKTFPKYVTLEEIGIGSLIAIDFQQRLQRYYNISFTIEQIRKSTVGDLEDFESGNIELIEQYSKDCQITKAKLSKIRFQLPNQPLTKLNDVSTGKPIYFLPPIESIYHHLIPLAKLLPFPVYGLNWTNELEQMKSIEEFALRYDNLMKTLESNGDYNLLTINFGSVIALRMAYKKAPIKKIFILDSVINDQLDSDENTKNVEYFKKLSKFIEINSTKTFVERLRNQIFNSKLDQEEKINRLIESLRILCSTSYSKELDVIIKGIIKKANMIKQIREKYIKKVKLETKTKNKITKEKLKKRIKSELIIIKSCNLLKDQFVVEENLFKDFGFSNKVSKLMFLI